MMVSSQVSCFVAGAYVMPRRGSKMLVLRATEKEQASGR
jgi:hypothetical protein